jgi:hypothetical protein
MRSNAQVERQSNHNKSANERSEPALSEFSLPALMFCSPPGSISGDERSWMVWKPFPR